MTRNFELTLTSNGITYNLYTLISADAQIGTPEDETDDFVNGFPKQVARLTFRANGGTLVVTKPAGTVGVEYADDTGDTDETGGINGIDLSDYNFRGGTNGMKVDVRVTAL